MQCRMNQEEEQDLQKEKHKTQLVEHNLCPSCFSVIANNQSKVTLTPRPRMKYIKYKYMYTVYAAGPFHIPKYNLIKQFLVFVFFFTL